MMSRVFALCLASLSFKPGQAADEDYATTGDRLAALRAEARSSYKSGSMSRLVRLAGVLEPMVKNRKLNISCRLAATGITREVKGYIDGLNAADADARKIAASRVRVAKISVRRDLTSCE